MQTLDWAGLRARHPLADAVVARGVKLHRSGQSLVGACPIHGERRGMSFVIWPTKGRWHCFGACACGGDLFDLDAKLDNTTPMEAARRRAGLPPAPVVRSFPPAPRAPGAPTEPKASFDAAAVARMGRACLHLAEDKGLLEWIAASRGWDAHVLRVVALEGLLGWEGGERRGDLLFCYPQGIKARTWPPPREGPRGIRWLAGDVAGCLWRQDLLWRRRGQRCDWHKPVRRLVVLEGETDVLSALCAGVEGDDQTIALGLPSASATVNASAGIWKGLEVVLLLDADDAGRMGAARIASSLASAGVRVKVANLAPWLSERKEAA